MNVLILLKQAFLPFVIPAGCRTFVLNLSIKGQTMYKTLYN